jgi:FAD/FMN-containing dehydrogenase
MIDRRPAAIARPTSEEEEALGALAYAVEEGLPVAIRGGGHSVAGHSCCEGGLVLRLLRQVTVHPSRPPA